MIELTWHAIDAEGEEECGAFEVPESCTLAELVEAALADLEERSGSFNDYMGEPVGLRIEFPCAARGLWLDVSAHLTSPQGGEQANTVPTQNGG
jgi:hypothetical protein